MVRKSVIEDFPSADFSGGIVWINMLPRDTEATAQESARIIEDPRVRHFHDPERRAGRAIAASLGGQGKVAWDIYLFFAKASEWVDDLPTPTDWMHQLSASWADPAHFHFGEDLAERLRETMHKLTVMRP